MATERFARFDDSNVVQDVILINSDDYDGDTEFNGAKRCAVLTGYPIENFKKCNWGDKVVPGVSWRGVTPVKGVTLWDPSLELFKEPSPKYPSWVFNSATGSYDAPQAKVEKADDGVDATYAIPQYWDEASGSWKIDDYTVVGNLVNL